MRVQLCCIAFTSWVSLGCDSPPSAAPAAHEDAGATDARMSDDAGSDAAVVPDCDVEAPVRCDDPAPRYADVSPIFSSRCVACHNGAGEEWPLTSYQHVADWSGEIRAQMLACSMPPPASGLHMPIEERALILQWLRCGFPR